MKNRGSGEPDLLHDAPAEQPALEAQRVHHAVPGGAECGRRDRVRDAQRHDEVVLPVERPAVEIELAALDHVMVATPFRELLDAVRQYGDVVVHHPEPFRPEIVRDFYSDGKPTGTAKIVGLRSVHHTARATFAVGVRRPPQTVGLLPEFVDHVLRLVGVFVVDDDDAPWRDRQLRE